MLLNKSKALGLSFLGISLILLFLHLVILVTGKDCFVNKGFSFGFLADSSSIFTIAITAIALIIIFLFWLHSYRSKSDASTILGMLFVASLVNFIDRIVSGGVCDYLKLFNVLIFNIPDIIIVVSVFMIFLIKSDLNS